MLVELGICTCKMYDIVCAGDGGGEIALQPMKVRTFMTKISGA